LKTPGDPSPRSFGVVLNNDRDRRWEHTAEPPQACVMAETVKMNDTVVTSTGRSPTQVGGHVNDGAGGLPPGEPRTEPVGNESIAHVVPFDDRVTTEPLHDVDPRPSTPVCSDGGRHRSSPSGKRSVSAQQLFGVSKLRLVPRVQQNEMHRLRPLSSRFRGDVRARTAPEMSSVLDVGSLGVNGTEIMRLPIEVSGGENAGEHGVVPVVVPV
jgi:hypothetical protein